MLSIFRWSLRAFLVLLFIFIISISTSYYLIIRSIPEFNAEYSLDGLKDRVEITRDRSSIPHIIGSNDNDIFFGLGFVHAQDRLWQMMLMRRTSQGKLSEIFGQKTVKTDILMRELGIYQSAKKSLQIQDSDTLSALVAYSNGINRWIETVNKKALGRGAPEFFLFKKKISPWVPEDSIAVLNLLSFQLSTNIQEEIIRALASERLTIKEYTLLFGDSPPKELKLSMDHSRIKKEVKTTLNPLKNALQTNKDFQLYNKAMGGASNVFAIGPTRSVSKSTLLANDPHLSLTAPSIWYLARLGLKSGDAIGATIPGIPSILSGRTDKTAWGITSAYVDDQDIFLEKLNPLNNNQYETEFGSLDFELNETIIKVKDSPDVAVTIKKTRNGPILSGNQFNIRSVIPEGYLASLSWTALSTKNTSLQAVIRIMKAQDVKGILNAGSEFYAPAQNLVAIDKTTIAIKTIGKIPKRTAGHTTNAKTPSEGWISQNRWNGYFSYSSNPENISPKSGTIINTNNRLVNSKFPNHITYDYGDTQRVIRLKKLISKRPIHTKESLIEYQQDIVSVTAQNILPIVASSLWAKKAKTTDHKFSTLEVIGLDLLANWTGEMSKYQPEPLIYVAWMRNLQMSIVQDELGNLSNQFQKFNPDFIKKVFLEKSIENSWCNLLVTNEVETCQEIAETSYKVTIAQLAKTYGSSITDWQWGSAHKSLHKHSTLGTTPLLDLFFNIKHSASGGENTIQRAAISNHGENPYENIQGPGYRAIYDLSDPDSSLYIISTGQSGNVFSKHYDDLNSLWSRGEYITMSLNLNTVKAGSTGLTVLIPKN